LETNLQIDNVTALVLTPVAKRLHFADFSVDQFLPIIDMLEKVHNKNVVHNDITPENLFFDENTKEIFLNDWGSACNIGTKWSMGTVVLAGPNLLTALQSKSGSSFISSPRDDLHILVRCLYCLVCNCYRQVGAFYNRENIQNTCLKLSDFWKKVFGGNIWETLDDAASNTNYAQLRKHVRTVFTFRMSSSH